MTNRKNVSVNRERSCTLKHCKHIVSSGRFYPGKCCTFCREATVCVDACKNKHLAKCMFADRR